MMNKRPRTFVTCTMYTICAIYSSNVMNILQNQDIFFILAMFYNKSKDQSYIK